MSDFEDRLRAIAKEISRTVERNIDDIAESFGVDASRAREFADAAGQWINDQVESQGDELFSREPKAQSGAPAADATAGLADQPNRSGPHPLDLPTGPQGLALSALDSGRWTVRPGSNMLGSTGVGPTPTDSDGLVGELRARDWITAAGELTLVGRRALARWYDSALPTSAGEAHGEAGADQPAADA